MAAVVEHDSRYRYIGAWLDCLDPKAHASAPPFLPGSLHKLTGRATNQASDHNAPQLREGELRLMCWLRGE
jgi:hypothetical protein